MAEENMDPNTEDANNETNIEVPPMDKDGNSNVSRTTECIQNYIENPLDGLIKNALSEETIACINYKGQINVQQYKLCLLLKAKEMQREYFGIKNAISTTFLGQACLIDANVAAYIEKTTAIAVYSF